MVHLARLGPTADKQLSEQIPKMKQPIVVIDSPATAIALLTGLTLLVLYMISKENEPQNLRIKALESSALKSERQLQTIVDVVGDIKTSVQVIETKISE